MRPDFFRELSELDSGLTAILGASLKANAERKPTPYEIMAVSLGDSC